MPATEIGPSAALLEELRLWVEHETPTSDPAAINALMDEAAYRAYVAETA
jgi:glutamate carboxypeptidase